jgi:hypothetical protein
MILAQRGTDYWYGSCGDSTADIPGDGGGDGWGLADDGPADADVGDTDGYQWGD